MKNFEVTSIEDNKKYWISRSLAVLPILVVRDNPIYQTSIESYISTGDDHITYREVKTILGYKDYYVAINKRGEGVPNYKGCWNLPCGYLDWDETLQEACSRELLEENKIILPPNKWYICLPIDDKIEDKKQNVTIRFKAEIDKSDLKYSNIDRSEEGEVETFKLMRLDANNIKAHRPWAFNHEWILNALLNGYESLNQVV